uniref:Uncharacterized protein n=1 Tax=Anopheles stephensi TaxID=30069 RepID=A0A182XXN9_ANOST
MSPVGKGRCSGGGGGGGALDSSGSDHSSESTTAAEMVAYNLSGEIGDVGGTGVGNGGSPGGQHHLHLHHHQGSIGSSASSGLLVVAAGVLVYRCCTTITITICITTCTSIYIRAVLQLLLPISPPHPSRANGISEEQPDHVHH